MYLFKNFKNRIEYVVDGKALYIWITDSKRNKVNKSSNLNFEVNELTLSADIGDVEINPDDKITSSKK